MMMVNNVCSSRLFAILYSRVDVDECTIDSDDCVDGATCVNTAGSFTCSCPPGFNGDGRASDVGCSGKTNYFFPKVPNSQ